MGENDLKWRKNEENRTWRGKNRILRSWKYEVLCFFVAVI